MTKTVRHDTAPHPGATAPPGDTPAEDSAGDGHLDIHAEIARLAALSPIDYEYTRKAAAKRLGFRSSVLDDEVRRLQDSSPPAQGTSAVEVLDPWHEPVDTHAIAESIRQALQDHVVFPAEHHADAATLWILGSWLMDCWQLWPKLLVQSPEKRCGKTTMLQVVEAFVPRGLMTTNISAAALFRSIEAWAPTLLIDEADRFLTENQEANGIVNGGHTRRTARVLRVVERDGMHGPESFSVWAPMVIASIGAQMDTLEDRSIRIGLKRRLPSEAVQKLPFDFFERVQVIRRQILRWSEDVAEEIAAADGMPPPCGNDRAQDNWQPLWRVAQVLGGPWPARAHSAYLAAETQPDREDDSLGVMLLRDLTEIFEDAATDRLASAVVLQRLLDLEDRPWRDLKHGKGLTQNALARFLKPYGLRPQQIRFGSRSLKGYSRAEIDEACQRYCAPAQGPVPGPPTETPEQAFENNGLSAGECETRQGAVSDEASPNLLKYNKCSGVSVAGQGDGSGMETSASEPQPKPATAAAWRARI